MRIPPWAASVLVLSSTACLGGGDDRQYALLEPQPGRMGIGAVQHLETTREPGASPPTVYGQLELSAYAVERFESLEARVTVSRAQPFQGEGVRALWLGGPSGLPILGHYEDELSTIWSADLASDPCSQLRCILSFEITPAGQGQSAPSFDTESIEYELRAWLEVRGQFRSEVEELDGALAISLEEAP